jgi:hydrogenase nickel incorporation protein HypA/HybF
MHEVSVATALIRSVLAHKAERNLSRISQIVIRIGPLSGIMPEALQFAYDSLRQGTLLQDTELVMQESGMNTECRHCHHAFDHPLMPDRCPRCGSEDLRILGGDEFYIQHLVTETE